MFFVISVECIFVNFSRLHYFYLATALFQSLCHTFWFPWVFRDYGHVLCHKITYCFVVKMRLVRIALSLSLSLSDMHDRVFTHLPWLIRLLSDITGYWTWCSFRSWTHKQRMLCQKQLYIKGTFTCVSCKFVSTTK